MKIYAIFDSAFFSNKPWWMPHKLHQVVCQRSNSRSEEYMNKLVQERFPEVELINSSDPHDNSELILLYPDAIGLGWSRLEKKMLREFKKVTVLNGRHRYFDLNHKEIFKLRLRRFLECTFLPEMVFAPFILILGITLAIKDKIIGRS